MRIALVHSGKLRRHRSVAAIRFVAAIVGLFSLAAGGMQVLAQGAPTGILMPGNAAVTGFSGAIAPAQIPPGFDPWERTFIDLGGAAARVLDLSNMGGPAAAQVVPAPKPFTITAGQIGQVFAVALDNMVPPNIYVAATSAYGLPIVMPGPDGQPVHVRTGSPNASFMAGLWGQVAPGGGPGSIWKIDGVTGSVSLFANVTLNGAPNSGPALGGLAYDLYSNSLFVADRATGMIHRFGMNGAEHGRYDHGVDGRVAQALAPAPFDPNHRLDITSPQFNSEDPGTWAYAPPERRIFGLSAYQGRLYYAVAAGSQIWSVGLLPDGAFGADATVEITLPPAAGPAEISKIAFDDRGRMLLAERPVPRGAFDFEALTPEGIGRVLRYALVESYPGAPRVWQQIPDEYAIGFPLQERNGNGGIAIGYSYDPAGVIDRGSCGGFLWSTGERLRKSADPALAARLMQSGPEIVNGLQGNRTALVRPQNVPPLQTYFVSYDDRFGDDAARGQLGDVAIWRVCGPVLPGGWMLPVWWWEGGGSLWFPPPPPQACPVDQKKPGFHCCPNGAAPDASGQCKAWCPNGAMDAQSQQICGLGFDNSTYDPNNLGNLRCIGGAKPDPAKGILGCVKASPVLDAPVCQAGWSKQNVPNVGTICMPTPKQLTCGPGQQVSNIDNQCHALCPSGTAWPTTQCCAPGEVVSVTGQCCPAGSTPDPKTGQCHSKKLPPPPVCPPGQKSSDGVCCPAGLIPNNVIGGCCPQGQVPAAGSGICKPIACAVPPNKWVNGKCCSPDDLKPGGGCTTPPNCVLVGPTNFCCDPGHVYTDGSGVLACCAGNLVNGKCQPSLGGVPVLPNCSPGSTDPACCANGYVPTGNACCLKSQVTSAGICCPSGQSPGGPNKSLCQPSKLGWGIPPWLIDGSCPPDQMSSDGACCPAASKPDSKTGKCGPSTSCPPGQTAADGTCCPAGATPDPQTGKCQSTSKVCCATGLIPLVDGSCCAPNLAIGTTCCSPNYPPDPSTGMCKVPVPSPAAACYSGYTKMPDGSCCQDRMVSADGKTCGSGQGRPSSVPVPLNPSCPPNTHVDARSGLCFSDQPPAACQPPNQIVNGQCCSTRQIAAGQCGPAIQHEPDCGRGQQRDARGNCVPETVNRPACGPDQVLLGGRCVSRPQQQPPPTQQKPRCGPNQIQRGNDCVDVRPPPPPIRLPPPPQPKCGPNQVQRGNSCVDVRPPPPPPIRLPPPPPPPPRNEPGPAPRGNSLILAPQQR